MENDPKSSEKSTTSGELSYATSFNDRLKSEHNDNVNPNANKVSGKAIFKNCLL